MKRFQKIKYHISTYISKQDGKNKNNAPGQAFTHFYQFASRQTFHLHLASRLLHGLTPFRNWVQSQPGAARGRADSCPTGPRPRLRLRHRLRLRLRRAALKTRMQMSFMQISRRSFLFFFRFHFQFSICRGTHSGIMNY